VWPAAIRPQTPAVPGTKRPPGFGRHSAAPRLPRYDPGNRKPGRHGRAPRGTLRTHRGRRRPGRDRQTQSEAAADDHLRCWCRAQGVTHTRTRKAICLAGKKCRGERGLRPLAFTHTHRPRLGGRTWCNRSGAETLLGGTRFTMGVVRARLTLPYKVGHFFSSAGPLRADLVKSHRRVT
jgi:hypothetical protein